MTNSPRTYDLSHMSLYQLREHLVELVNELNVAGLASDLKHSDQQVHIAELENAIAHVRHAIRVKELGF